MTLKYRFMRHVIIQEDNHWIWIGYKDKDGYGQFQINNRPYPAHRVARHIYEDFDLESKEQINHKLICNIRACVNPNHTYEGTQYENMQDRFNNITHCINGHEYTISNTYIKPNGNRDCRICKVLRSEKFNEKVKSF